MTKKLACALTLVLASGVPAVAQIPATFTNLQVLPKDSTRADVVGRMRAIAGALGARCTTCHVGPDNLEGMDFATDERPAKQTARTMMRMVESINANFMSALPASTTKREAVACITCHRRSMKPPQPLSDMLLTTIAAEGPQAGIAQYRKLRAEMLDSGMYDFREATLNIVATSLRDQKKLPQAVEILKFNAEMFPRSIAAQLVLGDAAAQTNDPATARAAFRRALELEPGNAAATRGLASLDKK
jgi:hypothetical protein